MLVGILADLLDARRGAQDREVAAAKGCAEAFAVIAEADLPPEELLPDACMADEAESSAPEPQPPNARTERVRELPG